MSDTQLGIVLRPTNFDEVIGQEDTVRVMRGWVEKGEVPRSVMLVGPAGTGKTTLAKILGRTSQGWEFPADSDPDMLEINAANMTGVDDMRELIDSTQSYPMTGKYRIIILDEAHMLSKAAQNVLLKPFEEANSATVWIICTTETAKIIPALVTRCQRFDLTRMTKKDVHTLLERAAKHVGHADFTDFEAIAIRENLNQPRPLLNAFGNYANGMGAAEAINAQLNTYSADAFEIAKAVVYGQWGTSGQVWGKPCKSVKDLFADLEAEFKKKKKAAAPTDTEASDLEADDARDETAGRPEVSRAIRAIAAALLKNEVYKGNQTAADCLYILGHQAAPPSAFDTALEYPCTVAVLYRINKKLRSA